MKATGIVRRLDKLGRIVIPSELRETFNIGLGAPLEIFIYDETIVLQKYESTCALCGSKEDLTPHHDKWICNACRNEIAKN